MTRHFLLAALFALLASGTAFGQTNAYIRINQAGYLPADTKTALAFSKTSLRGDFVLRDNVKRVVFRGPLKAVAPPNWGGSFPYYYELDFSSYRQSGRHVQILKKIVPDGLIDGPIAAKTYNSLRGLRLNEPDEFAEFQTAELVYHDDVGDYLTNEPTMDGTADAILMMALWNR